MKRRSLFHVLVFLTAILMFSLSFAPNTLQAGQSQMRGFAAESDTYAQGSSCLMPGVDTAPTSHVPRILYAHQLLGKSPEYVVNYTQTSTTPASGDWIDMLIDTLPTGCVVAGAIIIVAGGVVSLYIMWLVMDSSPFI